MLFDAINLHKGVRYLGMIQFYHRFIPKAAQYFAPLNDMLRGNAKGSKSLSLNEQAETTFFQSKSLLTDASLLVFPTANSPISIYGMLTQVILQLMPYCRSNN